jgi:hypothetical protein
MIRQFSFDPSVRKGSSWFRSSRWLLFLGLATLALTTNAKSTAANSVQIELGRRIYMEGLLASGKPLQGKRANSVQVEGSAAACETCHRRSGMGSLEGNIVVPPITGRFLFAKEDNRPLALVDPREPKNVTRAHIPYTQASLTKAIREGVNVGGRALSPLMPHYDLSNEEIKAVIAYLKQLSADLSPGVGIDTLHFATIITPGVDPKQSEVMINMMQKAFKQRNASQEEYSGRMRMPLDLIPRTLRNWTLTVWELKGTPDTWEKQLTEYYRKEPVIAVISGISKTTWMPVHKFCQQENLPCMLPNITLAPAETSFYPLYFSRGVALEADVLAKQLRNLGEKAPHRLVQLYRDDEVGQGAAQALTEALHGSGIEVESRVLSGQDASALNESLKDISSEDALMMWLRPADLMIVNKAMTTLPASNAYVSGFLANEDYSFASKEWLPNVKVIYPYELGDKRQKNATTLKKWLKTWDLPMVDETLQTEVFFNLLFLTDLTSQMLDNFYRDYMVERAEDMLSLGSNVSAYPRLSLARGQRFASKGAYIAHLTPERKLVAESDWIVP